MEKQLKKILKSLKVNENLISTIMGAVVVLLMAVMVFNYFKSINKNGVVTDNAANNSIKVETTKEGEIPTNMPDTYTVKPGDDLWHISEKVYGSGYNYVDIVNENKIANPNAIEKGVVLKLPKVSAKEITVKPAVTKTANIIEGTTYTVKPGDHLWKIAVEAYGDGYAYVKIYNANKDKIGANPSAIEKGMVLSIPR